MSWIHNVMGSYCSFQLRRFILVAAIAFTIPSLGADEPSTPAAKKSESSNTTSADSISTTFTIFPVAPGEQLVRLSLPCSPGFLRDGQQIIVQSENASPLMAAQRVISWYPSATVDGDRSARRVLISFPWTFPNRESVQFTAYSRDGAPQPSNSRFPATVDVDAEQVKIVYDAQPPLMLQFQFPERTSTDAARVEAVEVNQFYQWHRYHFVDAQWPRVIETRLDILGGLQVIAHLQRTNHDGHFAPDIACELLIESKEVEFQFQGFTSKGGTNRYHFGTRNGNSASSPRTLVDRRLLIYHPTAPLKQRGSITITAMESGLSTYRYSRCAATDEVPMQPFSWQRCEIAFAPSKLAQVTSSLNSPHAIRLESATRKAVYPHWFAGTVLPHDLQRLVDYHRDAIVRSSAVGDDFGNFTSFADSSVHGGAFGMNRLNHAAPIFEEGWRSGQRRLIEAGLLWDDNFFDQSIWWGPHEWGGTRYNNVSAMNQTPPNTNYMWRSDSSVSFCTKGYDSFWLAWEETGDPRYLQAFQAQVDYASKFLHAGVGTCRNVGDVRDFIRLYQYTGQRSYLDESLRLFRELRERLFPDKQFSEGGQERTPDPPFIDDDAVGLKIGYAKPYIIGYALAGLPELLPYAPNEPDLKETIQAVADFLAESVDPCGGWRYPHPKSTVSYIDQGIEHAWQITQAARAIGPNEKWLDAIETVLRARILFWKRTGLILSNLTGWEISTGKISSRSETGTLYQRPADRDPARDYTEGRIGYGTASPEGLVYFPEVLEYYLQHRDVNRLLSPPEPDEPLAQMLNRVPAKKE